MTWVLLIAVTWAALALAGGMLMGRTLRAARVATTQGWIDDVETFLSEQPGARTTS
jgi:hypothetical protein